MHYYIELFSNCYLLIQNNCMRRSQPSDRHAERRAGDIGEADIVAKITVERIAAMFAADTQLDVRAGLLAQLYSHLHQLADAFLIQLLERVGLINLVVVVCIQELYQRRLWRNQRSSA